MSESIEVFDSIEQRLQDVRKKFDLHLNKSYLSRLLDGIDESDHTRVVLQAVIMILGYNYMSDRTLHIVFDKESTIKRIKTWNKCKLQKQKVLRIKNWMEFRPQTFGEASGYKGDRLLHALRDWCIIMVANKTKATKKITNEEREIKTLRGSPKNTVLKKTSDEKLDAQSQHETMNNKATMPRSKPVAMKIRISKVESSEKEEDDEKKSCETKTGNENKNTLQVPVVSDVILKKGKMPKAGAMRKKTKKFKKSKDKSGSKGIQCKILTMEKGVSSSIASMTINTADKSIGTQLKKNNIAIQTIPNHERADSVKRKHIAKAVGIRKDLKQITDSLDENLDVLFQAKEQLEEARKELRGIKLYRNKRIDRNKLRQTESDCDKKRDYILRTMADYQQRLQKQLESTQSTFYD